MRNYLNFRNLTNFLLEEKINFRKKNILQENGN